jgi:hypothetical protein
MSKRGRRTIEELKNVPTHDMTPAEYRRSDDDVDYTVTLDGAKYHVHGIHSAKAIAGKDGTIKEGHE